MAALPNITIKDRVKGILDSLRGLTKSQVLVGIPEDKSARDGEITNAALGYIHEFGAPAANIPARPHLIPGVRKSAPQYLPHLRKAAESALEGDPQKMQHSLMRAGIIASSAVRREITTGNFVPLSPVTVWHRHIARGTQSMRPSEKRYLDLVYGNEKKGIPGGMTPAMAQAATGIKPLINTGQLRNAYTYVIRRVK
jgi:hypothetical protein